MAVLLEVLENPARLQTVQKDPLDGPVGDWLHRLSHAATAASAPDVLAYRLDSPPQSGLPFALDLRVVRILKSGRWGADRPWPPQQLQNATAKYMKPDDRAILRLQGVVATGRCRWRKLELAAADFGSTVARPACLAAWR